MTVNWTELKCLDVHMFRYFNIHYIQLCISFKNTILFYVAQNISYTETQQVIHVFLYQSCNAEL
jgi:hypothetical protein